MPRKAKPVNKILKYDPWQRTWIYEIIDPHTNRPIYVGRTNDVARRGAEHDRKGSPLLKEYHRLNNIRLRDCVRVVPKLPNGVPASRSAEFEAYFIVQRDTLYHPTRRPDGCNQKHGDFVVALDYKAIEAEIATGFEWPEVPVDVVESRAKVAVFGELVAVFGDSQPDLKLALYEATVEQKTRERAYLTPLAISEQLAEEYEKIAIYEEIDRTAFERDINTIRDRLNNEDVTDDKMLSLVRAIAMFGKSEGAEWQMRAHVGANAFKVLAGALETREEARLPDTTVVKNMKNLRDWIVGNGGKKPSSQALRRKNNNGTAKEESFGSFLYDWKTKHKKPDRSACDFLMRHVVWWKNFVSGSKATTEAHLTQRVNAMLKDGYGHANEPMFDGKKRWPVGSDGSNVCSVYKKMHRTVNGVYDEANVEQILNGVEAVRADWYRAQSAKNRPVYLSGHARCKAEEKARYRANGIKARKKRKLDEEDTGEQVDGEIDEEYDYESMDEEDDD